MDKQTSLKRKKFWEERYTMPQTKEKRKGKHLFILKVRSLNFCVD